MTLPTLSPHEVALLREVRVSDEDHGGLHGGELAADEYDAMKRLCELELVEALGEYGEAPDGEEDEREAGASDVVYRITHRGVVVLAEHPSARGE
jgi:translation elongation factor EF-Tu-like GTPase